MTKKKVGIYNTLNICTLALLCAMQIVFARFLVIPIGPAVRFSLSFIPVVIAARRYGIGGSVAVYGLGDFLGALLFPSGGAFQVGFTLTAIAAGFIYGIFLYENSPLRKVIKLPDYLWIIISTVLRQGLCSLLFNCFWLNHYYGLSFFASITTRVPQSLIVGTLEIIFMFLFLDKINKAISKIR